jgi:transcriptional regulator with XRE-family HTH domain
MLTSNAPKIAYMQHTVETIGDRIKRVRLSLGLTQEDVAKAANISAAAVSQIESGNTKSLRPENLFPIAAILGKDAEWLATGKGAEQPIRGIVQAITELPDDNPQDALDFIQYKWSQAHGVVASDKIAKYSAMIAQFKADMDKRKKKDPP